MGQLVEIEPGRGLADTGQVEPFARLIVAEQLVVAMGPAEAGEVVAHGLGQIAHLGIFMDGLGPVALGQLGPVGTVNQGDVGEGRANPRQGIVDQ